MITVKLSPRHAAPFYIALCGDAKAKSHNPLRAIYVAIRRELGKELPPEPPRLVWLGGHQRSPSPAVRSLERHRRLAIERTGPIEELIDRMENDE